MISTAKYALSHGIFNLNIINYFHNYETLKNIILNNDGPLNACF